MDPQRPARRVAAIPTLSATGCSGAKLLVLMTTLAEIKQWRLTLTPDTAAADEPAGHRAEKLLASDRRSRSATILAHHWTLGQFSSSSIAIVLLGGLLSPLRHIDHGLDLGADQIDDHGRAQRIQFPALLAVLLDIGRGWLFGEVRGRRERRT